MNPIKCTRMRISRHCTFKFMYKHALFFMTTQIRLKRSLVSPRVCCIFSNAKPWIHTFPGVVALPFEMCTPYASGREISVRTKFGNAYQRNRETNGAFQMHLYHHQTIQRNTEMLFASEARFFLFIILRVETESRILRALFASRPWFCVQLDFYAYYTPKFALTRPLFQCRCWTVDAWSLSRVGIVVNIFKTMSLRFELGVREENVCGGSLTGISSLKITSRLKNVTLKVQLQQRFDCWNSRWSSRAHWAHTPWHGSRFAVIAITYSLRKLFLDFSEWSIAN